jgi:regulator of sirC expression with transglutaminase-like and TPR domain
MRAMRGAAYFDLGNYAKALEDTNTYLSQAPSDDLHMKSMQDLREAAQSKLGN